MTDFIFPDDDGDVKQNPNPTAPVNHAFTNLQHCLPYEDIELEETREEIFGIIRDIRDPEWKNYTLGQLGVVHKSAIYVSWLEDSKEECIKKMKVLIEFCPTVPHCTLANLIDMNLYKLSIAIATNTHESEQEINKQINDKERTLAAAESPEIQEIIKECLSTHDDYEDYGMASSWNGLRDTISG